MSEELLRQGTTLEIAQILLFAVAVGFAAMTPLIWIFGKIIALREVPDRRALWTTAIAYLGAALIFIFGSGDFLSPWLAPMLPLPGAVIICIWLRHIYRKGWVDEDKIPEGTELENSDWRVGVGIVVSIIVAAGIKVAFIQSGLH